MVGGCCCKVENRSSVIPAFATMNIVIFAGCLLICSKEFVILSQELAVKNTNTSLSGHSDYWEDTDKPIFRLQNHLHSLIAAIVISALGIIAGIALLRAPKRGHRYVYIIWMFYECIAISLMLVLGGFITHLAVVDPMSWHSTISKIPFSAFCMLCSCPFLLWSLIVTCTSFQSIFEENQRQILVQRVHKRIPLINVCKPSFEIPPSR